MSRGKNPKQRLTAFTLLEIMVAVSIVGIVLATVGANFKSSAASPHGTALALAAALTEARQQAVAQQVPVALIIPSGGGTQGQADSYYIAAGDQPRITRVRRFASEQPNVRLMVGHWPLDTTKLKDPTLTTTLTPPAATKWEDSFQVEDWGLPNPQDFAFIFTPRGRLVSNDLPHFDGAYHIVVSNGGRSTVAAPSGTGVLTSPPTLFQPTEVGSPYTVNITTSGAVSVTAGVTGVGIGVSLKDTAATIASPLPPALDPPPAQDPVVTKVTVMPDPATLELPSGVDMLLAPDKYMTMTVRAKSPERVPLFCQWTVKGGGLSSAEPVRMTYLPEKGEWESVWQWQPPQGAATGDQFALKGRVLDSQGNEAPVKLSALVDDPVVQVGDNSSTIYFTSDRDGSTELYSMNVDGTGQTKITDRAISEEGLALSPDGNMVGFYAGPGAEKDIYVMNADGSGVTNLTNYPGQDAFLEWSSSGGRIAFQSLRLGYFQVYVVNADGSGLRKVPGMSYVGGQKWSPDDQQFSFQRSVGGKLQIHVIGADGTGRRQLTSGSEHSSGSAWSPDIVNKRLSYQSFDTGQLEAFTMNADGSGKKQLTFPPGSSSLPQWSHDGALLAVDANLVGNKEIYVMKPDGTDLTRLTNTPDNEYAVFWSPDSSRVAFCSNRNGDYEIYVINADGTGETRLTNNPGNDRITAWR
jgi:prepilin-type N-terminal cleavage/methylation domain-containing protein